MDSCNFTDKPNSHTPTVELNSRRNLRHFGHCVACSVVILSIKFRPGYPGCSVHTEKFSSRLPRSREPAQPGFSYEHIEIFMKERVARRDLGSRASSVDRAHMERQRIV